MTGEVETLLTWTRVFLGLAAFFTTMFPVLYSLARWHETRLGRALMLQGIAFAFVLDLTFLFSFWTPTNMLVIFWANMIGFGAIAATTGYLTWKMLKHNIIIPLQQIRNKETQDDRASEPSTSGAE